MEKLEIPAVVRGKNQLTIPHEVAQRHNIVAGQRVMIVDGASEDEFTVRVLRGSYAGALAGVFGTTDENVAFARGERESWV